jgi:PAS domain S-box-containing protein
VDSFAADTVTECLPEPVFAISPDGDVTFVNRRFLEVTQLSRDEVIGRGVGRLGQFVADGFETLRGAIEAVSRGAVDDRRIELSMRHPPSAPVSEQLPAEARVAPIPRGEAPTGALVTLRDVSEQKERRQELERQNERLEEFASLVSHDLRNPLHVAELHLELAREQGENEHLEAAADALSRSQTLIEDLLTLARKGDSVGSTEPVSLRDLAAECWQTTPTAGATLSVETDRTIPADRSRLRQLFENLFSNAAEHGGEGVTVTVGDTEDGFYVADDGAGIPEGERGDVFEAGYSTAEDGTGFGLRIVEEIAEAHGWSVSVTESAAGGARIEIGGSEAPGEE